MHPARSLVTQEIGVQVWERLIAPHLNEYISRPVFERACRDYLWRALRAGKLPESLRFTDVGTWWGGGDIEIDVVALDERGIVTAAGSCKWTEAPMDVSEYAALQKDLARSGLDTGTDGEPFLFLFSRSGFTERLITLARQQESQRLVLVSLEAMYEV